jgi:hypothetical protein
VDSLTPKQELQLEMKYHLPIGTLRPGGVMNAGEPGSSPGLSPSGGIGGAGGSTPAASPSSLAALPEQKLPKLPYGGTALPTEDAQGAFSLLIKPSPRPWLQAGGLRRLGVQWDPILKTLGGFGEQDFFSLKAGSRAIVFGVRPFVDLEYAALPGQKQLNVGVPLTAAVDF